MEYYEPTLPVDRFTIEEPHQNIQPFIDPLLLDVKYELAFPEPQRTRLRNADNNRCQMPILDGDGLFISYANDPSPLTVHHILPEYFFKDFKPGLYRSLEQHSPLNGITLGRDSHNIIHRDWIHVYHSEYSRLLPREKNNISFEAYVRQQTASGRPGWLSTYDPYFKIISALNTYDYLTESSTFPFPDKYKAEIDNAYWKALKLYPEFVESYYANRGWFS